MNGYTTMSTFSWSLKFWSFGNNYWKIKRYYFWTKLFTTTFIKLLTHFQWFSLPLSACFWYTSPMCKMMVNFWENEHSIIYDDFFLSVKWVAHTWKIFMRLIHWRLGYQHMIYTSVAIKIKSNKTNNNE